MVGTHRQTMNEGIPGMYEKDFSRVARCINKEGSALRFGTFVTMLTTDDRDGVEAYDAQAEAKVRGVLAYDPGYTTAGALGNTLADDEMGGVVEFGRVLCLLETGQAPARGDAVFARATAEEGDTILGAVRTDEDTNKAGLIANARFDSEAISFGDDDELCAWVLLLGPLSSSDP